MPYLESSVEAYRCAGGLEVPVRPELAMQDMSKADQMPMEVEYIIKDVKDMADPKDFIEEVQNFHKRLLYRMG